MKNQKSDLTPVESEVKERFTYFVKVDIAPYLPGSAGSRACNYEALSPQDTTNWRISIQYGQTTVAKNPRCVEALDGAVIMEVGFDCNVYASFEVLMAATDLLALPEMSAIQWIKPDRMIVSQRKADMGTSFS